MKIRNTTMTITAILLMMTASNVKGQEVLYTIEADDLYPQELSNLGDVNSDGVPDFIVRVQGEDKISGARVYSGGDGSILYTIYGDDPDKNSLTGFGVSISNIGDLDGDDVNDFIVGEIWLSMAHVYSGIDGSLIYTLVGEQGEQFGTSTSGIGDINLDGIPDFIVSAPGDIRDDYRGKVSAFSGSNGELIYTVTANHDQEYFGSFTLSELGDIDLDGVADFIVHARKSDDQTGSVHVISGVDGWEIYSIKSNKQFSFSSSSNIGDVNLDGISDYIVGSPFENDENGVAYIFSGANGSEIFKIGGNPKDEQFGRAVCGIGDINSDGIPDFIVSAPGDIRDDYGEVVPGSIYFYSGADASLIKEIKGDSIGDNFGYSINTIGDINSDGISDLIVGSDYEVGYVKVISGAPVGTVVNEWSLYER